jgi:tetratricopeptide (TPR) repeat protein
VRRLLVLVSVLFVAAPAHAEWWEARTDHFIIYSQDDERDTRKFATELERYDNALRSLQSVEFKPLTADWQRVTIYRLGDVDDIGRLAHAPGVAGFYKPTLIPVEFTPVRQSKTLGSITARMRDSRTDLDPKSVLFHEYAHHFMFQYFPAGYPSWYVEAFAETLATIDLHDDGSFHLGNPPQWRSDDLFHSMLTTTPQSLLASSSKPDFEDFYSYYSVGWLMNHYLTFEPTRRGQLQTYLKLVDKGVPSGDAARQAFGDLDKLGNEINSYKNKGRLYGADVRPANTKTPTVQMRRLSVDEEAVLPVKVRSKAGVTHSEAGGIASDARDVAREFPNSVAAELELYEAEFDAERLDAAEAAADRALQLQPDSIDALIDKGQVLLEKGKKDKQYLAQARTWLAKAHDLDLHHPAPLLYNYLTYWYSGERVPEPAAMGLEQAYLAAPHDRELRLVLTRQLLSEGKGPLARDILLPLALNPHEGKDQKNLHAVIDLIDAKKVDEAYKAMVAEMDRQEAEAKKDN